MQILQGIAVSPGVAIGEALVIDDEGFRIPRRFVTHDVVDDELNRLTHSMDAVAEQLQANCDEISAQLGSEYGAIFAAHLQMLRDPKLNQEIRQLICEEHYSPEYAVSKTLRQYAQVFQSLDDRYLAERANDLFDLEKRLLGHLLGECREELTHLTQPVVVLAHNLTPSETARLDPKMVIGFVTEIGGQSDHTAIVAEALEIPAIVGIGGVLSGISGGDQVIVDGEQGLLIHEPDEETLERYREQARQRVRLAKELSPLVDELAQTKDGVSLHLSANIEFPEEVQACCQRGADGVGLYRTEFLYLGQEEDPSEDDHYKAYIAVAQAMHPRPVVIRTLDLGADKLGREAQNREDERNPFLGVRSIRLSLRNLPLFRTQLRAVLRASALGNLQVMFPMITALQELRQAKMVLREVMEDLEEQGIEYDPNIPIGIMVEVPSAVILLDRFLPEVDFLSIGTNDLTQYVLAVDRGNKDVAELYRSSDLAVLRLIKMTLDLAKEKNVAANLCGQMCGNPLYTMLLIGLGLRSMSVRPSALLEIKHVCRSVTLAECEEVAEKVMCMESAREIERYMREELRRRVPDAAGYSQHWHEA